MFFCAPKLAAGLMFAREKLPRPLSARKGCLLYTSVVLMGISPLRTFLVCVPTRILAGWLPGVIFQAVYKAEGSRRHWLSFAAASLAGPVLNTVFFMSALVACFYGTEYIQGLAQSMGAANPFVFAALFVGIQGRCV